MPYITEYAYHPAPKPCRQRAATWALIATIVGALGMAIFPFWPQLADTIQSSWPARQATIARTHTEAQAGQPPGPGNWLLIPSIQVQTPIVEGNDVGILDREEGVWRQTGTAGAGNFVIAGHRFKYLPPNQMTLYHLDKLVSGDMLVVWWEGQRYQYQVSRSWIVGSDAVEILNPTSQEQLTLYTCTNLNASKRLVVVAKPLKPAAHR